jgi:prepilin-type N-terminal cleavage/methylation domain-containing protein/prepilin-type processing-associated H-X9-DG protein
MARFAQMRRARAFTLVELLVVVSIIALLVALVFPSLRAARTHTRIITCQTNLSGITKGLIAYALERDAFPITTDAPGTPCSWRYGGWSGSNTSQWKSYKSGAYYIPTGQRPLSRYLRHESHLPDSERMAMFRCPEDNRSYRAMIAPALANGKASAYEDIGTSYHLNWHWFETQTSLPDAPSQNSNRDRVPRGERVWWKYFDRNAARFVALIEDPADYGFHNESQTWGYHKKFSKHNFAFLDGHTEYILADTRSLLQRGRWTLIDETPPYKEWLPK